MLRTARERRIRLVLAVGCLTAVATSPAEPFVRWDEKPFEMDAAASVRVTVRANDSAHLAAEQFTIDFRAESRLNVDTTIQIVPDDRRLPTHTVLLRPNQARCLSCIDAGVGPANRNDASAADQDGGGADEDGGGVVAGTGATGTPGGQSVSFSYDVTHELCPERGDCEIGFTLSRMDEPIRRQGVAPLHVHAHVVRDADPTFFCPDNRDFKSGATVEIEIDE